jgi:hypothetical protein
VFEDRVNVVECKKCKSITDVPFSLLATNVKEHFAVWYEPFPDPAVDNDKAMYEAVNGPGNFYSEAPRLDDWNEFKNTILKFERGELVGKPPSKMDFQAMLTSAARQKENRPSLLSRLFKRR